MTTKKVFMKTIKILLLSIIASSCVCHADPLITSWYTANGGKYARVYTSTANRTAGISATTWTSGQTSPTYAGVHEIDYSANWVYIRNTGLASYIMGPWNNPNVAKNQGTSTSVYRFPRNVAGVTNFSSTKTLTPMGSIGFLVDGVAVYNTSDGFSYSYSNSKDATPNGGIGSGDGYWNRDAWTNEYVSFDYALNHPQPQGQYHAHANPIAIRYQLGDNVNYNSTTKNYSENTGTTNFKHSPILGWMNDGLPLYGPYGYSNPTNPASPVRRMVTGYVLRDGSVGNTNYNLTGRTSLPIWSQAAQGRTITAINQYGPNVSATYPLGHFVEDFDYLGDLGFTQGVTNTVNGFTAFYDLNKYNTRFCVTPEYPGGTWAYFVTLKADSSPVYPFNVGRWFFNSPTGGSTNLTTMNSDTPLTQYYKGFTNIQAVLASPAVNKTNGSVTLTWSAVEGGTYQVNVSSNLTTWTTNTTLTTTATNNSISVVETGSALTNANRYYRAYRSNLAAFDSAGY
jgi:hypothetical protein